VVIAIDGPAGAGKSTVSRALAERLGATYLDSGAMYRSVALMSMRAQADPDDPERVVPLAEQLDLGMEGTRITIGGEDVSAAIRTPEVSATASRVSVHPGVRTAMVARQRELLGGEGNWVAEGRDIGTVVCPQAELKVYMTSSYEERASRRAAETGEDVDEVLASIRDRDARDSGREHGALAAAEDSVEVDTTGLTLEQVVARIAGLATERGLA
jgi:cytidylate kinase